MLRLSSKWVRRLTSQPETGMDYQIAAVILKDGRRFDRAVISAGSISSIRDPDGTPLPALPFTEEDIADIVVTNEKWPGFPGP